MQLVRRAAWFGLLLLSACGSARLAQVDELAPGDECPAGGVVVREGGDDNGDGALQDSEVESSETRCNGIDAKALVDTAPEPAGANCPSGGTRVRTGVDMNGNDMLDDDEVQNVAYICNAAPTPTVVSTENEPPSSNCPLGGVIVRSGMDLDADGALDPEEVTSTSYVCTGQVPLADVVTGNFYLRNAFDQALLANVKRITGTLYVMPDPALPAPVIPNLEEAGAVAVSKHFASLTMLRFVRTMQGFSIEGETGSVATLQLPLLDSIGGSLVIDASELAVLELPALTQVTHDLWIKRSALSAIAAPELASIGGRLEVNASPILATIDLPSLTSIADALRLSQLPLLAALDLGALADARYIELVSLPALQTAQVELDNLAHVPDGIIVQSLPWTSGGPLASLRTSGFVAFNQMNQLTSLDLPLLESGGAYIQHCPLLVEISGFENLLTASEIVIAHNAVLGSISGFSRVANVGTLTIANSPVSSVSGFSALTTVSNGLEISRTKLSTFDGFAALQQVGSLDIQYNDLLVHMGGFASLRAAGAIAFVDNPAQVSIPTFGSLESLGSLHLEHVGAMTTISLPQVRGDVYIRISVFPLTDVSFPQVTSGTMRIAAQLSDLSGFAALRDTDFDISSTVLTTLALPALQTGRIRMQSSPELTMIDLPLFRSGGLRFESAPKLASLSAPLAVELTDLWITGSMALRSLEFPALERVVRFTIQQNAMLERFSMPSLQEITGFGVLFVSSPRLPACQVSDVLARVGYAGPATLVMPACEVIDVCRLHAPVTVSVSSGDSVEIVGRVSVHEVTDASTGIDSSVVMRYQVGCGPRDSIPDDTWTWINAMPTAGWNDAGAAGYDEYRGAVAFPAGSHDVAARFSGDGGLTWTACDLGGSDDGYQIADAGHVEAQ